MKLEMLRLVRQRQAEVEKEWEENENLINTYFENISRINKERTELLLLELKLTD